MRSEKRLDWVRQFPSAPLQFKEFEGNLIIKSKPYNLKWTVEIDTLMFNLERVYFIE